MEPYFIGHLEQSNSFSFIWIYWGAIFAFLVVFRSEITNLVQSVFGSPYKKTFNIITLTIALYFVGDLISSLNSWHQKSKLITAAKKEVSGEIQNFKYLQTSEKLSRREQFDVSGVSFTYNNLATKPYFFANRKYKENKIKNGAKVTIVYLNVEDENYILEIYTEKVDSSS